MSPYRRLILATTAALVATALSLVGLAGPAAATTLDQKLSALSSFTQTSRSSYSTWYAARQNQSAWASYGFDWSTDYCSDSPDQPLGFDFRLSCARHDFGYRNYKAVGLFSGNKDRVDSAFYEDLKAKCATYSVVVRSACYGLAWTYYNAVHLFGALAVSQAQVNRYAASV
jgi:hypothetical protein